ncbi:methylenetetrahydrofolate reductase [Patescibacteria group bacterium]|nr:MAG: methylenetetrahydrofolate reductase [Patescibacteria group bacterium]
MFATRLWSSADAPPTFSMEVFPPRPEHAAAFRQTITALASCRPAFFSLTCGNEADRRPATLDWAARIQRETDTPVIAHLTCLGQSRDALRREVETLLDAGVANILALRGDMPRTGAPSVGFRHAAELIAELRTLRLPLCIGAACHPQGHPEAANADADLRHLREKVDAGADFLVTQAIFDVATFTAFLRRARTAGVGVPVLPGILVPAGAAQIQRFAQRCGVRLPRGLPSWFRIEEAQGGELAGLTHAAELAVALPRCGAPGVHLFTMNREEPAQRLHARLRRMTAGTRTPS